MKAVTYQGVKDVKVKEVPDAKIEKPDELGVIDFSQIAFVKGFYVSKKLSLFMFKETYE